MPAPLFTRENAAENARKATASRLARIAREKAAEETERALRAQLPIDGTEDAKKLRVQKQIETCDRMMETCLDPELFVKLVAAKARLWELLYPKPGSLRPKQSRAEARAPIQPIAPVSPTPIVPPQAPETTDKPQAVVPPNPPESHNS